MVAPRHNHHLCLARLSGGISADRLPLGPQLLEDLPEAGSAALEGKRLTCTVTGDWLLSADQPLMERVIDNFLSNVLRFTPPGGTIAVTLREGSFTLENSGSHIPEEQLPLIWQACHKADPCRSGDGLGLGLYLAGEILALHGLSYRAANTEAGVQFVIAA